MKVVSFGEIMLRLSPSGYRRFQQARSFDIHYGGSEANVSVLLAQLGVDSYLVTKIPDNPIGNSCEGYLKGFGVKTDWIIKDRGRLGIYFLEQGYSQRPSLVVYDRKGSVFSLSRKDDFQWDEIFEDADWFHFSGITPALGENLREILKDALKIAKDKGIKVSCDLNYRSKLWPAEEAQKVMRSYMEYVDVLIANEEDLEKALGENIEGLDLKTGKINRESYVGVCQRLMEQFEFDTIGITLRESLSSTVNLWSGLLCEKGSAYFSRRYEIHVVDRVGAGDSFTGGLIYATLKRMKPQERIEFAVAASCLKHSIPGDFPILSENEIIRLARGNTSGRVIR